MNKFLAGTFIFVAMIWLSIAIMVYGWGLQPVSWWWILGGGVGGRLLLECFNQVAKAE